MASSRVGVTTSARGVPSSSAMSALSKMRSRSGHSKTQGFSLPGAGLSDQDHYRRGRGEGEFLNGKGVLDAEAVEGIGNLNGDAELRECRSAALFGHAIILSLPHYDRGKPYHCC